MVVHSNDSFSNNRSVCVMVVAVRWLIEVVVYLLYDVALRRISKSKTKRKVCEVCYLDVGSVVLICSLFACANEWRFS